MSEKWYDRLMNAAWVLVFLLWLGMVGLLFYLVATT
jgi:hypothetical protein